MRIALVSPYSWTYRGGVNRHVEALAEEFTARGEHVRVLAPWDPPDKLTRRLHRSAAPEVPDQPDYLVPLGRTIGIGANGAVSNISPFPEGLVRMRRELRSGGYDVIHVHEPPAPLVSWDANTFRGAPVVGTFHAYATKAVPNHIASLLGARRIFNQLSARIAVSEAAAWTGRRWFGGDYTIVPNGVDVAAAHQGPKTPSEELRLLFVGRAEERKGLPVLLAAFQALVEHVPARLTVIGADPEEVHRAIADPDLAAHVDTRGKVSDAELWTALGEADLLCAPSLSGESFGMVLIEAMASGTPPVASAIAGYSDVVSHGVDGVLVPSADPQALGEELLRLAHEPERRAALGEAGRESAERYAWPRVAGEVGEVYERAARPLSVPVDGIDAAARRAGLVRIDGGPRRPARCLPSLDAEPSTSGRRRLARRLGLGVAGVLGLGLTYLAARKIGVDKVAQSVIGSDLTWVLIALALMVAAMFARAGSWVVIARAALPGRTVRRRDVTSATMIGVLMSATLPARLGEPARATVLARRIGRMRETFAVLIGTLVSQTMLNILALALLGVIIVNTTDLFHHSTERIFLFSLAPLVLLIAVLLAPFVVRTNGEGRIARAAAAARRALGQVCSGLVVFKDPRRGTVAAVAQLGAWLLQLLSCWVLFAALGLDHQVGIGAAAAVLFAVNVTAVIPATPSNIGVFQFATVSVLAGGFGVGAADALAYGVILQAVEIATAVGLGLSALLREGVTWKDMRLRAISAAPVQLQPHLREREARDAISA
ncbi:MAG: glycosyltransferase [Actinobacteria bacterium]|nr:glycosyltransferase [Actinomycetota bacterium]